MNPHDEIPEQVVGWPPLHDGHNEPGPTDQAGEYRAGQEKALGQPRVGLAGQFPGARVPGEVRPGEQPIDTASESSLLQQTREEEVTEAERSFGDPRHIIRGKHAMSSSEGSS
ncbi:MAG TPA: hypothetical protein VK457_25005 [Chloroflexota bacterium]|nr:hypothetical protein [Chloroflexota bacterium]